MMLIVEVEVVLKLLVDVPRSVAILEEVCIYTHLNTCSISNCTLPKSMKRDRMGEMVNQSKHT